MFRYPIWIQEEYEDLAACSPEVKFNSEIETGSRENLEAFTSHVSEVTGSTNYRK